MFRWMTPLVAAVIGLAALTVPATAAPLAAGYPTPVPTFTPVGNNPLYTPAGGRNSRPLLTILTTFSDLAAPTGFDEATMQRRVYGPAFPNIAGYFAANSFGNLRFTPANEGCGTQNGVLVVNVGDSATYLGPVGQPTSDEHQHRLTLDRANDCVNFAQFDRNNNGQVTDDELVILNVRTARNSGESCGATRRIEGAPTYDGKQLTGWVAAGTSATDSLTLTHEAGHVALGARDLYGFGIGSFDLFGPTCGGGVSDTHSFNFSAWQKKNLGWVSPTVVTRSGYYTIPRADTNAAAFLLYDYERGTNDYFMVENRRPTSGTYDKSASDTGLAIYRIDDTKYDSGNDNERPIEIMRADGQTNPGCPSGCYSGSNGDAWDAADSSFPQREMRRTWRDGTAARVSVRAIGPAGENMRAYFQVRGPGILVDPYGLRPSVFPGEATEITFPVSNTGEATDTFRFTLKDLPAGWTASTDTQTLAAGQNATARVQLTPPLSATATDYTFTSVGTSSTDTTVTSDAPLAVRVVKRPTTLAYTGSRSGDYHHPATVSAVLKDERFGTPIAGRSVTFRIGGQTASATTDAQGSASTTIVLDQQPGTYPIRATFNGDGTYLPSSVDGGTFTIEKQQTTLAYNGDTHIANGTPAKLSAQLREDTSAPIAGRTVNLALGTGSTQQSCSGTTDAGGTATCTIAEVSQPLVGTGAVPVAASFAGDAFYKPSTANATVLLLYMTGRAQGVTAWLKLLPLLPPVTGVLADTGPVTTPSASTTSRTGLDLSLLVLTAKAAAANVRTSVAPGKSTADSTTADVTVGLPSLPVVTIKGVRAESTTTCAGSTGNVVIDYLAVGGEVVIGETTTVAPNTKVSIGGITLLLNEQLAVPGGLHVNGVHLTVGGTADVVVSSVESDIHNCKP